MSQKTDSMIKLALVFFVTLLSFSVGTYVGKKYSDNQHKLSLLEPKKETPAVHSDEFASEVVQTDESHALAENTVKEEQAATSLHDQKPAAPDDQKPAALTDSEVAKIAEEFAAEDEAAEEKIVANIDPEEKDLKTISDESPAKHTEKPTAKLTAKQVAQLTPRLVAKLPAKRPVRLPAENRVPASADTKKEVAPMLFTVQIGSYPSQTEAEKITQELQSKGFKTSFIPANVNGQMWYRVNVGLFGSVKEAQDYKKEFLIKTKLSSAIVQRVTQ